MTTFLPYNDHLPLHPTPSPNIYTYPIPLSPYDSDLEVLLPRSLPTLPSSQKHISGLQYLGGNMYVPPSIVLPPQTDDTIIPAIIVDVIPSPNNSGHKRSRSILGLGGLPGLGKLMGKGVEGKKKEQKGILKVIYMPKKEYNKWFARGLKGEYVGTEPFRRWREEELETEFGRYRPPESTWKRRNW